MITVLSAGDVDSLDPAVAYGTYSIGLLGALQRRLFTYGPGDAAAPRPDLAEAAPEISGDGRTVTGSDPARGALLEVRSIVRSRRAT